MAGVESVEHSHCQWLELHPDLLKKIAEFINSAKNYVRARATCKAWNSELPKVPKHIKGPWLVLALDEDTFDLKTISSQLKAPHLRMSELKNTLLRGSCFGWLISVGLRDTLQVSNPFTRFYFNLPPISTFPHVVSYQPDSHGYTLNDEHNMNDSYIYTDFRMQKFYISKIVFSCSPNHREDFMAVAIYGQFCSLAYYKFGDDKWTHILTTEYRRPYHDVTFHEGKIYAIARRGSLYEFDMKAPFERVEIMPPHEDINTLYSGRYGQYLVWNHDGDLLLLIRHWERYPHHKVGKEEVVENYCYRTSKFDIYKLNRSKKKMVQRV